MPDSPAPRGIFPALLARVADLGAQFRAAAGGLTGKPSAVQAPRQLSQQYLRLGAQRPETVSAIMRQADAGYLWQLCDLLEDQRTRDSHLQTVCSRRERAVANLPWQVIPASDRPRDLRVAAWVENVVRALGNERVDGEDLRGLSDTVTHINAAPIHGHAAAEVLWRRSGRYVVPLGSLPIAPRRFIYGQDDARLRWFDVMGGPAENAYPGKDLLRDFADGRFLVNRPRINGAVGSREGLIRPLVWASLFRTWLIADGLKLAELAWKPYRKGEYTSIAGEGDIADLEEALQQLTSNGWTTYNKDKVGIVIEYAKNRTAGDGGLHMAFARFLGEEMSKVATGHTLTVEEGNRGTARTAGTAENVSAEVRDIDARGCESVIQRQLVAPLVRYNFGKVPVPTFRFVTEQGGDVEVLALAIERIRGKGDLPIPLRWVWQILGSPEPDEGEALLGGGVWKPPSPEDEAQQQPAEKPAGKPDDKATDDTEGPDVSEKAMRRMQRAYAVDLLLREAGVRRPWGAQKEAA